MHVGVGVGVGVSVGVGVAVGLNVGVPTGVGHCGTVDVGATTVNGYVKSTGQALIVDGADRDLGRPKRQWCRRHAGYRARRPRARRS